MENTVGQRLRGLSGPLLLTGHTGFKGTWMTFLLEFLKIPVIGYSLPAEKNSLYERAKRIGSIPEMFADIRNYSDLESFIDIHRPSTIIHMAAQPLVLKSYENPRETFEVNVMGTVNILDIAFRKDFVKAIIVVTTDKVYRNDNSGKAFIESDPLEGKDPYSASKVGTEAVITAWQKMSKVSGGPQVVSVRAGNVIGGGDFGENRLLPDLIKTIFTSKPLVIRNLSGTRPWQYVLDPLYGYLLALIDALDTKKSNSYNFSPNDSSLSVEQVLHEVSKFLNLKKLDKFFINKGDKKSQIQSIEASNLSLNSQKAYELLSWTPKYPQKVAIKRTLNWWYQYFSNEKSATELCIDEIRSWIGMEN
jgi:CDP-glucose 4,6-dehydratase